jgi:hypothetical protein
VEGEARNLSHEEIGSAAPRRHAPVLIDQKVHPALHLCAEVISQKSSADAE